jgi:zinc protease
VVQKEHVADLDVWLVRFANGVRLNLKRTDYERGQLCFQLRYGTGRLEEPSDQPGLALWAGAVVTGGVGRHTNEELRQIFPGSQFSFSSESRDDSFYLSGATATKDFADFVGLITAYMTDPAFRPEGTQQMQVVFSNLYSFLRQSSAGVIALQIRPYLGGGDVRLGFPPREVVERYSMEKVAAWLKPTLQSGAIEITLVGDFDVELAITEMTKTFGALPPRTEKPALAEQRKLKFPVPPNDVIYTYPLANRPTTLLLDWPVRDELTPAEQRRLKLLASVLEDRLRVQIREERGETYSPAASFAGSDAYPGFADLRCQLDVKSKLDKKVMDQVRDLAVVLAQKGVTEEELQRAKAQAAAGTRQQLRENGYWLEILADAQERPWRIAAARTLENDYAAATKAEIDALAARYLIPKNLFRFIIKPVPPKS